MHYLNFKCVLSANVFAVVAIVVVVAVAAVFFVVNDIWGNINDLVHSESWMATKYQQIVSNFNVNGDCGENGRAKETVKKE